MVLSQHMEVFIPRLEITFIAPILLVSTEKLIIHFNLADSKCLVIIFFSLQA